MALQIRWPCYLSAKGAHHFDYLILILRNTLLFLENRRSRVAARIEAGSDARIFNVEITLYPEVRSELAEGQVGLSLTLLQCFA